MDAKSAAGLQRDEELEASPENAVRAAVDALQKNLHTCLPGIVKSFDPDTQTVSVQPAIKRIFVELGPVDLPLCVDVPVVFPSGGDFILTFPVRKDDECLLIFSERAIDFWFEKGDVQLPSEYRLHDLSDAFALVGVRSKSKAGLIPQVNTSAAELRTKDGTTVLRIDGTSVYVGGAVGAQPAILGSAYRSAEDTYFAALETYLTALGGLPGMTGPAGVFATAANAFHAAAASYLAQKAKVL